MESLSAAADITDYKRRLTDLQQLCSEFRCEFTWSCLDKFLFRNKLQNKNTITAIYKYIYLIYCIHNVFQ